MRFLNVELRFLPGLPVNVEITLLFDLTPVHTEQAGVAIMPRASTHP